MKKNDSKNLSKRLARYGALTLAIAGVSNASGQIVYTDVDPDEGGDQVHFLLDLNGDFITDYEIRHNPSGNGANAIRVHTDVASNAVLGMNGGGNYNYPFALDSAAPISSGATDWLQHSTYQTLNWNSCSYSGSQWCGVTDKYLGLRFDIGGNTHYGWARLDVGLDPTNWLIKGYAYNSTPDEGIAAGDEGTLTVGDQYFKDFIYFVDANSQLNLRANAPMENLQLVNIIGQEVISQKLANSNEIINISSLKSGIYIASISINGNTQSFKIVKK